MNVLNWKGKPQLYGFRVCIISFGRVEEDIVDCLILGHKFGKELRNTLYYVSVILFWKSHVSAILKCHVDAN